MNRLHLASLALALAAPCGARAQSSADIDALRKDIASLRVDYEARLQALEQRLAAAQAAPPAAAVAAAAPNAPAAPAARAAPDAPNALAAPPAVAAGTAGANAFNPAISLILSGLYAHTSRDPADYRIGNLPLPDDAEVGPGGRGFSLAESELGFSANIDPWWRGAANIALAPDNSVSVEEAYVQTTALGAGFTLKAGRFFSGIGYLNEQHAHTWDFVDNPLAYQALLGTQYGDDGLQLRWIAPTDLFLEFGAELGRGRSFPGSDGAHDGAGMRALYAHAGGDIGTSQSWRAGLSMLRADAADQGLNFSAADGSLLAGRFSGRSTVNVVDAVWKWAPDGNPTRRNFKLQGEYLRSRRDGTLLADPDGAASSSGYRVTQSGWYLQGIWQFEPRWRVGARTEQVDPGTPDYGDNQALFSASGYRPRKNSLTLDFSTSEFARLRLQWARDLAREGQPDQQLFLQYQMSLGAHGAHSF